MRKIKIPKNNMDIIDDICHCVHMNLRKYKKISAVYYLFDNESGIGTGGSNIVSTEQLCFMLARIISNRANALKMDRRDLLFMIENKLDFEPDLELSPEIEKCKEVIPY